MTARLLTLWVVVGYVLALPVTVPDQMAYQDPALRLCGSGPWWVLLGRAALVLVLGRAAVAWAAVRFDAPEWSSRALALSGAAGLAALLCYRALRWWDDGGLTRAGAVRPPARYGTPRCPSVSLPANSRTTASS
ncbi:hypothetical protein [Streptomyces bicolor]|uniref:hypothetical protein n=1 Tax=Streptomyces bicolor TaxID=66874 RepID=UPI0004E1A5D3|nr:hypothetical protein [Streptomyces bicolor]